MEWQRDDNLKKRVEKIISTLFFTHIDSKRIVVFKSYGSRSRARARIWGFPRIWQKALNKPPFYCLEVLAEKFDKLDDDEKTKILIHELLHIPQNFSGALLPHRCKYKKIDNQTIENMFRRFRKK